MSIPDIEAWERREQIGLDTRVVCCCKRWVLNVVNHDSVVVNTLSTPPGDYERKFKTQRNWRELAQAVEHVV